MSVVALNASREVNKIHTARIETRVEIENRVGTETMTITCVFPTFGTEISDTLINDKIQEQALCCRDFVTNKG